MRTISDWGNYPQIKANVSGFSSTEQLQEELKNSGSAIAYGNGRSYGDASLQKRILLTRHFNKLLAFDEQSGLLTCQSGVLLSEILDLFVPRGWFLPVTPGTKLITVGGAIAADVHGKNHHLDGTFGEHIVSIDIMRNDGTIVSCSPTKNKELFYLTVGGMGLTGIILSASFHLKKIKTAYIRQETIKARNLNAIMDCFEESANWSYSVAWIDCLAHGNALGRSIMMRGEHATVEDLNHHQQLHPLQLPKKPILTVPFMFPNFALNPLTMRAFNFAYYKKCPTGIHSSITDYNHFFYPLDAIAHWNRIYGKRGFTQYQFVIPKEVSRKGMHTILSRITQSGLGSFLAVLKLFGKPKKSGLLSFPIEGYTLALDFPISKKALLLFKELDAMVSDFGGRLYLAKDSRMNADFFQKTYTNASLFKESIMQLNHGHLTQFASLQSERIGISTQHGESL